MNDVDASRRVASDIPNDEHFVRLIDARLRLYGTSRHGNKHNPLDELLFIILSAQTEAYSYQKTYDALIQVFPDRSSIIEATDEEVAAAIRGGGLAYKKARQIKGALAKILTDFGILSLDSLADMSDADAETYLLSLPGIGIKSAKCILLYSLRRSVFPVDTHVWRVCRRLNLAPALPKPTPRTEELLEATIPPGLRYSLHVNLLSHGQLTCLTYWPRCGECALVDLCPSAFSSDEIWGRWRQPQGAWARAVRHAQSRESGNLAPT